MDRKVVLIPDRVTAPDIESAVFGPSVDVICPGAHDARHISDDVWARADAVLAWHELRYPREVLGKLARCRVLVRVGAGFDNVDLAAAGELGIVVCNVPDYGTGEVADHAMALVLAVTRGIVGHDRRSRRPDGWEWMQWPAAPRVAGATLLIIGLGRIGTATALRAQAFGMKVGFYDPYVRDGLDKALGLRRFEELFDGLRNADVVSLHTPLTDETRSMVNRAFVSGMKPGSILVNTARGPIVDLDALYHGLRTEHLFGAGLDVLPHEPPLPHRLLDAWREQQSWIEGRLIITPHSAFYSRESYAEMRHKAALEALRVMSGRGARNCVNSHFLRNAPEDRIT